MRSALCGRWTPASAMRLVRPSVARCARERSKYAADSVCVRARPCGPRSRGTGWWQRSFIAEDAEKPRDATLLRMAALRAHGSRDGAIASASGIENALVITPSLDPCRRPTAAGHAQEGDLRI